MCGRFASTTPPDKLAAYFGAEAAIVGDEGDQDGFGPDYNVAPTRDVATVRVREDERKLDFLRWGLVPRWAKDLRIGSKMINARAETVATKNSFRSAFKKRRCIITADGFYEWKRLDPKTKQPMYIHRVDGAPLAFAGLYERWTDAEQLREIHTCTIITTTPNAVMEPIHNRMPVLLPPARWDEWLDPGNDDTDSLQQLLVPAPNELLTTYAVSTLVNNVRNNEPSLLDPVG